MAQPPKTTILDHFADLDDPRVERTRRLSIFTDFDHLNREMCCCPAIPSL